MSIPVSELPIAELGKCNGYTVGSSDGKRAYMVLHRISDDAWSCSCPSTSRKACRHIRAIQAKLGRSDVCVECGKDLDATDEPYRCRTHFEDHLARQLNRRLVDVDERSGAVLQMEEDGEWKTVAHVKDIDIEGIG